MTFGMILAGGKASRLGPISGQLSKALVSIGNRPQLVNLVDQMRAAGATRIIVVGSKDNSWQLDAVVKRAGLSGVSVTSQSVPRGPVHGIQAGFLGSVRQAGDDDMILAFADTVVQEELPPGEWVGFGNPPPAEAPRSYCWVDDDAFVDSVRWSGSEPVTIGLYRFGSVQRLKELVWHQLYTHDEASGELGMAGLLNEYFNPGSDRFFFSTWQDVGDLAALAAAKRSRFIHRAHHTLKLRGDGIITKSGASAAEIGFMDAVGSMGVDVQALFPTVYGITKDSYSMEYLDLPSLAELWNYWPGDARVWQSITSALVDRMDSLWAGGYVKHTTQQEMTTFFGTKALKRLVEWKPQLVTAELADKISRACEIIGDDMWYLGHGDLNFTNILFSSSSMGFKLIDPRGGQVPLLYEYAKIAYSPYFSAITHDLPHLIHQRKEESAAVRKVLHSHVDPRRLSAATALTLLAAPPLHPEHQAEGFYKYGTRLLDRAIADR